MYPKVKFLVGSLSDTIYIINTFYDKLENEIKFLYPGINKDNIEEVVSKYFYENKNKFLEDANRYSLEWEKYSKEYFKFISKYLNIPLDIGDITCYVLNIPIYPRDLSNNSFYVGINLDLSFVIDTIKHEILHFYWFRKFHSLYPEIDRKEYDTPYLPWKYSEMVVDPILHLKAYPEFYENDDIYKLRKIFNKNIPIDDRIREGYLYLKNKK